MVILNGKEYSVKFRDELKEKVSLVKEKFGVTPGLAVVIIGEDPASKIYVSNKIKGAEAVGINSFHVCLSEDVSQQEAENAVKVTYDLSNGLYDDEYVVGSIVGIKEKNWARDFVARAYVLVDGVYYYSESTSVRNIAQIADSYINTNGSGYEELDADIKANAAKIIANNS